MKHPLGIVALAYIAGIIAGDVIGGSLGALFGLSFLLCGGAWLFPVFRPGLLVVLLFACGWINEALHTQIISSDDLRIVVRSPELTSIRGVLVETPNLRVRQIRETTIWRSIAQVDIQGLQRGELWIPVRGRIVVSTEGSLLGLIHSGQTVEITGVLHAPRRPDAPGLFDYAGYLKRQRIFFQLDAQSTNDWRKTGRDMPSSLADRFFAWGQGILQKDLPEEDSALHLLWAMTLGWKTGLTDDVSEPFMKSGTMHIFAISGLHIALIAGILVTLLRAMRVRRSFCGGVVIPIIWFYTAATGWQASAIRSTVMMTIIIGGWALARPPDLLNSLGAAALIVLIWDPQQLFQAGFQLSFFVVLSMALLGPRFEAIRKRLLRTDPFLPGDLRPRWQRLLDGPLRAVTTSLATSIAAWLGSLPLIAYYFHLVTPISLLANLLVVPLSSLALMSNLGSLICAAWAPWMTALFNEAGWFFMTLMVRISAWCASRPGAYFYVPTPPLLFCVTYYLFLFGCLKGSGSSKWSRLGIFGSALVLGSVALGNVLRDSSSTTVTVVPLNGGDILWSDGPGRRRDLLVDCGNQPAFERTTEPFLHAQGVNRLPAFLITHGDVHEMGAGTNVLSGFQPRLLLAGPGHFRSPVYRHLMEETRTPWQTVSRGDSVQGFKVLHPAKSDQFPEADDNSLVLFAELEGTSLLFLSDLGKPAQEILLQRENNLHADIVIAGLPARGEPLTAELLDRLRPKLIVITDSEFPATARSSKSLKARLRHGAVPVIYCRESGAVTIRLRKNHWEALAMDRRRWEGIPEGKKR